MDTVAQSLQGSAPLHVENPFKHFWESDSMRHRSIVV